MEPHADMPPAADSEDPLLRRALDLPELTIELGAALVPLAASGSASGLVRRITGLRHNIARELGFVIPRVAVVDNLVSLEPNAYRILLREAEIARGQLMPDRLLALSQTGAEPPLEGPLARDPAFGLPVRWIHPDRRKDAEALGLTVVDADTVLVTHFGELVRYHAAELFGREEALAFVDRCAQHAPRLVASAIPTAVPVGVLTRVLKRLLEEGVSIRDGRTILESLADLAMVTSDPHLMLAGVRRALARQLTAQVADDGEVRALVLSPTAETALRATLGQRDGEAALLPDRKTAQRLFASVRLGAEPLLADGRMLVIFADSELRRPLFNFLSPFQRHLRVMCPGELAGPARFVQAGTVSVS
jgi:flagellar biosynthesis protein FlhA